MCKQTHVTAFLCPASVSLLTYIAKLKTLVYKSIQKEDIKYDLTAIFHSLIGCQAIWALLRFISFKKL